MRVEIGHHKPHVMVEGRPVAIDSPPVVTYLDVPDEYEISEGSGVEMFRHLALNQGRTELPGHRAFVSILHLGSGAMASHGDVGQIEWVWVEDRLDEDGNNIGKTLQRQLAEALGASEGHPVDVEMRFFTHTPPGMGPGLLLGDEYNFPVDDENPEPLEPQPLLHPAEAALDPDAEEAQRAMLEITRKSEGS